MQYSRENEVTICELIRENRKTNDYVVFYLNKDGKESEVTVRVSPAWALARAITPRTAALQHVEKKVGDFKSFEIWRAKK